MMRVAIVVTNSDLAGAPVHCLHLISRLTDAGLIPFFFAGEDREVFKNIQALGVQCEVIGGLCSKISPVSDIGTILTLRRRLKELGVDLVHLHSSKAGLVGRLAAWSLGLPAIYTIHGWGFGPERPFAQSVLVRLCEWAMKPITNQWVAVSESDRQQGIESLKLPPKKVVTIYNGVPDTTPTNTFEVQRKYCADLRLMMVARDSFQKDYDTLFRALALIPTEINLELTVAGEGTDLPKFRERAMKSAGHRLANIRFMGLRDDISALLAGCDVFCLISRYEGLPIAIIEALRAGLPIIASNVGGVRELVVEGENGFLMPVGQECDIAKKICEFAEHRSLLSTFGKNSRSLYESRFTLEVMAQAVLKLYRRVASAE